MPAIHKRYEYETGGHNTGTIVAGVVLSALVLGCFILTIRSHVAKRRAACNIQDPPAVNLESLPMRRLSIESHGTGQGSQDPMKKKANFEDEFTEPAPPPYILPQDVKNPFIPVSCDGSCSSDPLIHTLLRSFRVPVHLVLRPLRRIIELCVLL